MERMGLGLGQSGWKPWNAGGAGAISAFGSCQESGLIVKPSGVDLEL